MELQVFNSNKNLRLIDYQHSYFYQQKRKKQRRKWVKFIILFLLVTSVIAVIVPFARAATINQELPPKMSSVTEKPLIQGPQLLFSHPDKRLRAALPVDITANVEVNGIVAYARIKQVFINPYNSSVSGKYQFPLPESSAIKHLTIKMADQVIIGQIMEKQAAKAVYQQAKKQGKKASLVQQQKPNLFTNNIANIPPLSKVEVTLEFIMPVNVTKNGLSESIFNLRLPIAITTRYQSIHDQKTLDEPNSGAPFDSAKETLQRVEYSSEALPKAIADNHTAISISLNAGASISTIKSASHNIQTQALDNQESQYLITLQKQQTTAKQDFEISWQLKASYEPQVSSFTEQIGDEYFTLLTFFPPESEQVSTLSRDIIFIIDTSGSMQGSAIAQAKESLQQAILNLGPKDSFNIIAFDDNVTLLFAKTKMASRHNINQAQQFINHLQADGGTEMYRPLSQALVMAKDQQQTAKAIRQVIFITDGAVANEFELMQLLEGAQANFRLFTVGIGTAPNSYFMKKAAQFGRGSYVFINNSEDVQKQMTALMSKINHPAITNISLIFDNLVHQETEVFPKKITDLYMGEPLQITVKSKLPITSVQAMGDSAQSPWYQQVIVDENQSSKGISTLWARRKIESLLDSLVTGADKTQVKAEVISTSIAHQTLSPYTSFIAVEMPTELLPITAKNSVKNSAKDNAIKAKYQMNTLAKAHENLMVAMPRTALGWHQQLLIGLLLMLAAPALLRIWSK